MPGRGSEFYDPTANPRVYRERWKRQMRGLECKYFVLKADEFLDTLSPEQLASFNEMLIAYNSARSERGKPVNKYYVVNRDEPYADQVRALIGLDDPKQGAG